MEALATPQDVDARIARSLTLAEQGRLPALLADVSATVRKIAHQDFTLGTTTHTYRVSTAGIVRLTQKPVVSITSVKDLNDNDLAFVRIGDTLQLNTSPLNAWEIEPYRWGAGLRDVGVTVTYTHGGDVPDDVVSVVCAVALRSLGMDPTAPGGVVQESTDGYSFATGGGVGVQSVVASGVAGLLPAERELIESYNELSDPIPT